MTEQAWTRVRHALSVLAVVVGLMAMHGLANVHHAAAPVLGEPSAAAGGAVQTHSPAHGSTSPVGGEGLAYAAAALVAPAAVADPLLAGASGLCDADCVRDGHGLFLLCVGILLAAAAVALMARAARRRPVIGVRRSPPIILHPRRMAMPRGPDPVTELCTSRT